MDRNLRPYRQANRGAYLDLAAPGVEIAGPDGSGAVRAWTGTSFATVFVTAAVAEHLATDPEATVQEVLGRLRSDAQDLGARGPDPIFGYGLVQLSGDCP